MPASEFNELGSWKESGGGAWATELGLAEGALQQGGLKCFGAELSLVTGHTGKSTSGLLNFLWLEYSSGGSLAGFLFLFFLFFSFQDKVFLCSPGSELSVDQALNSAICLPLSWVLDLKPWASVLLLVLHLVSLTVICLLGVFIFGDRVSLFEALVFLVLFL